MVLFRATIIDKFMSMPTWVDEREGLDAMVRSSFWRTSPSLNTPSSTIKTWEILMQRVMLGKWRCRNFRRRQTSVKSDLHDEGVLGVDGRGRS